jgi:hypothetical protein
MRKWEDEGDLMTLLRDIQEAALDSKVNLADLLRKCKVLAARLKHEEFATWVDWELNGYPERKMLPLILPRFHGHPV